MRRRAMLSATLLLGVGGLVLACGAPGATGSSASDGPAGSARPLSTLPPPTLTPPTAPPSGPTDAIATVTLAGRVSAGTPEGCKVLVVGAVTWVLVGPPAHELVAGQSVEVVGQPAPDLVTPCDGTALLVRTVRPA